MANNYNKDTSDIADRNDSFSKMKSISRHMFSISYLCIMVVYSQIHPFAKMEFLRLLSRKIVKAVAVIRNCLSNPVAQRRPLEAANLPVCLAKRESRVHKGAPGRRVDFLHFVLM